MEPLDASEDVAHAAAEARPVPVDGTAPEPRGARAPVPREHPVVEGEPQQRQVLVHARDRRHALEPPAQVVGEVPHQAARERRSIGRCRSVTGHPPQQGPRLGERIRALGRRVEDEDRVRGQEGPAPRATWPGALEQREARKVAERFGGINGPDGVERGNPQDRRVSPRSPGYRCETDLRKGAHRAMIG